MSQHDVPILRPAVLAAFVCAAFSLVSPGRCDTYTVGAGVECSADTIGEALLLAIINPGFDQIRVAKDQAYLAQQIVISNQSVSLVGGYDNCSDPTPSGTTNLSGLGGSPNPVIEIRNSDVSTTTVELANLTVLKGELSGIDIAGSVFVSLSSTIVTDNDATLGGGITLDGSNGAVLTIDESSQVTANTASDSGGGIYCTGGGIIGLSGEVSGNDATNWGGGIYLYGGTLNAFGTASSEISTNTADLGGGILGTNGASINLIGGQSHPVVVSTNTATNGGGIYLMGATTTADVVNSSITGNRAWATGGGLYVSSYASLVMDRDLAQCGRGVRCSVLENNVNIVTGTGRAGAIAVRSGGEARIRQTFISGNHGDAGAGIALVENTDSFLLLEGDMVYANLPGLNLRHIEAHGGGLVRLAFVSTAGNMLSTQKLLTVGDSARIELLSSVIGETAGAVFAPLGAGGSAFVDCVIAHEFGSMPVTPTGSLVVTDPNQLFVDPANGALHLAADSPAIDYCDTAVYVPTDGDIDDEMRGVDDPNTANYWGTFDIGADERYLLFGDGFESGNTSNWSATGG